MAVSISLTGISPLHGSHPALPIACDALNARTVAIGEYHYIFCAVMARKQLRLLYGKMFLARLPGREVSWRIFRIAKAQKESIRFALWYAAVILRVCLSKNRRQMIPALSAERGTQTATLLNLENQDSLHKLWAKAISYILIYAVIGISPLITELSHRKVCDIASVMLHDNIHCLRLSFGCDYDYRIR